MVSVITELVAPEDHWLSATGVVLAVVVEAEDGVLCHACHFAGLEVEVELVVTLVVVEVVLEGLESQTSQALPDEDEVVVDRLVVVRVLVVELVTVL